MKAKTIITALLIFLFLGLTGCGSVTKPLFKWVLPDFAIFEDEITSQGAEPVLDRDEFEKINLIEELKAGLTDEASKELAKAIAALNNVVALNQNGDEASKELVKVIAALNNVVALNQNGDEANKELVKAIAALNNVAALNQNGDEASKELVKAIAALNNVAALNQNGDSDTVTCCFDLSGDKARKELAKAFASFNKNGSLQRRNAIQERILAASNQRCAEFKNYLRQFQAEVNFGLGTATTTLAGLGAIFTPASTVRALSGAAAIASGVRAEFEENFFYTLATPVITEGIDTRREEIYEKIRKRQNENQTTYPIQAAVKDAIEYHGSCSTRVGFEAAGDAIVQTRDPGLKQLSKALDDFQLGKLTFTKDKKSKIDLTINSSPKSPLILELLKESVPANEEVVITAKGGSPPYSFLSRAEGSRTWEILSPITDIEGHIRK